MRKPDRPPYTSVYITHDTPGAVFQARLLDNREGASANTERYVFGKLSARCFPRRAFWHRHYSICGDTDHGKSTQGGVIYICRRIRSVRHYVPCTGIFRIFPGAKAGSVSPSRVPKLVRGRLPYEYVYIGRWRSLVPGMV